MCPGFGIAVIVYVIQLHHLSHSSRCSLLGKAIAQPFIQLCRGHLARGQRIQCAGAGLGRVVYNEPENAFVADFIGDSNIFNAIMVRDKLVNIVGAEFPCVDTGFGTNKPVDAVIRPEDIDLVKPEEGTLKGVVTHLIFKGVHYEMEVLANNYEWLVHSTDMFPVGTEVGIHVDPFDIQIMKKPESEDEEAPALEA